MPHRPETSHFIALMLAAMLAWPWGVALAARESARDAATVAQDGASAPAQAQASRAGRWDQSTPMACGEDYDETEDGDTAVPPAPQPWGAWALPPDAPAHPSAWIRAAAPPLPPGPILALRLCRFRC